MTVPEVLSVREFREDLAGTLRRVQEPDAAPIYVGAHRRPEAVVISAQRYRELTEVDRRREALDNALGSVRAEGLEPSPEALELFEEVVAGRLTSEEVRQRLLARYSR
ncbi:hypothetical protein GCM10023321_80290 [Pseudonocardia eucalypti]|uniref:Antitoxin VbhA domain-containing protein n=1 Tax=Pseudonocardia eucalypti TaxID=648755 RepID=A0ABP9RCD6_9PSEU|nr:PHD/YefM family antitoxin component YafN of YafNO toxin-antitoxin module [Pseudonocardia eucalypti]